MQDISNFLSGYRAIADSLPPKFNVFHMLNHILLDEVTHTTFLAGLFYPDGIHGEGSLFLQSFLRIPLLGLETAEISGEGWTVDLHKGAKQGNPDPTIELGIPDLTIKNNSTKHIIMIENKIRSDDHKGQLQKYFQVLNSDSHFTEPGRRRLIYLTPNGREPRHPLPASPCFKCMSYKHHVKTWLDRLLPEIRATDVQDCVRQYIQIIPDLSKPFVSMLRLSDEIFDYLKKPMNLAIAFDIAQSTNKKGDLAYPQKLAPEDLDIASQIVNSFTEVKDRIATRFCSELVDRLGDAISNDKLGKEWAIRESVYGKSRFQDSMLLFIEPRHRVDDGNTPYLSFIMYDLNNALTIGLKWNNQSFFPPRHEHSRLNDLVSSKLRRKLERAGFWWQAGERPTGKKVGQWNLNDRKELLEIAEGKNADKIFDELWNFFRETGSKVTEINLSLQAPIIK